MSHTRVQRPLFTWPTAVFALILLAGAAAIVYRMAFGLGASTNLSNTWPWGLWKGFNVLVLIAWAAGGFASAAIIYIFGGERYHGMARAGVLWAILGYGFAGASLAVDIGIPWRIINPIYMWPKESLLFEVAWCVMLYLTVLALELAPAVFERFGWTFLHKLWEKLVPAYAVAALTFFTYIMSHSAVWAAAALVFFATLAVFLPRVGKRPSTPLLLIMFGVILSSLHQSTLGSLFLLIPNKLSHFWWSELLPFNYIVSAVAIGLSVLTIERTLAPRIFGHKVDGEMLNGLSKIVLVVLWIYVLLRGADVGRLILAANASGEFTRLFGGTKHIALFAVEFGLCFLVPAVLMLVPKIRTNPNARMALAFLIAAGGMLNRLSATFLGLLLPGEYVPSLIEIVISLATFVAIIFLYTLGVKYLPIYPTPHGEDHGEGEAKKEAEAPPAPAEAKAEA
ncbi:MAG: hypothetical protein RBU30_20680 [Polyangia bacterium]|jgi:formate dehydrogenase iron-sulfur subunit|nr:hypothetical protein [Polyangia bacterium]